MIHNVYNRTRLYLAVTQNGVKQAIAFSQLVTKQVINGKLSCVLLGNFSFFNLVPDVGLVFQ